MSRSQKIDASEELDQLDAERARGATTLEDDSPHRIPGFKPLLIVLVLVVVVGCSYWLIKASKAKASAGAAAQQAASAKAETKPLQMQKVERPTPAPAAPAPQTAAPVREAPSAAPPRVDPNAPPPPPPPPTPQEIARKRRLGSKLNDSTSAPPVEMQAGQAMPASSNGSKPSALEDNLKPVVLEGSKASVLRNRDLMITSGSMIDCGMVQALQTDQPGMLTCTITRSVRGASGRVVLLDAGTKVTGQYQGALLQGQTRIFVLWTRAETPDGVIIPLGSPATGPLGEGGVGGWIDNHWVERFGGALVLSVVDDFAGALTGSSRSSSGGSNTFNFSNTSQSTQDMASEALKANINMKPTLHKNQGERVNIFVARDLDFSGVYSLERR